MGRDDVRGVRHPAGDPVQVRIGQLSGVDLVRGVDGVREVVVA
jgi:hypothetical protein